MIKKTLLIISFLISSCIALAQENPAPLPPNYERIKTETRRWFGEYRYSRLEKLFARCDTAMTVDHFRCLYYGAALRSDTNYTLLHLGRQYRRLSDSLGQWHPTTQQAWWRLQMLTSAVWSSGNGSEEAPFYVACPDDERYMTYECRDFLPYPFIVVYPNEYQPSLKETQRRLLVQQGLLPDEQQSDLFRQIDNNWSGKDSDSLLSLLLSTYDNPEKQIWAEIQVARHNRWCPNDLRVAIERHHDDTSALLADLYHLLAAEYYCYATEFGREELFDKALQVCDSAILLWPLSDGAERCRLLRERILMPEVWIHNDHQQHIEPLVASEWALATLWHRNAKRLWLKVYNLNDTTFQHPLYEWDMRVKRHDDLLWHEAYLYLPPMTEGRYLLRASTDRKFSTWAEIELVRSDRVLYSDNHGHGYVINLVTGEPVEGFPVEATTLASDRRTPDSTLATVLTDSLGMFDFSQLHLDEYVGIRALHAGIDLGRCADFFSNHEEKEHQLFCSITVNGQDDDIHLHVGDTVHFRCLLYTPGGPLKGATRKIYLGQNYGRERYDSIEVAFDSHGIGLGSFVLPKDSEDYEIYDTVDYINSAQLSTYPVDTTLFDDDHPLVTIDPGSPYFHIYEHGTRNWDTLRFSYLSNLWSDSVDIRLTVERLQVPQGKHWLNPTSMGKAVEHSLSEHDYRLRYPFFAYDWRTNNTDAWTADTLVFSAQGRFPTRNEGTGCFALPPLPEGVYRNTLTLYTPQGKEEAVDRTTFYSGHIPLVTCPFIVWLDTTKLHLGDTLPLHFETWLPDQQAVVSIQFNNHAPRNLHITALPSDTLLLIPIEEEGLLSIHIASAFHGEMTAGTLYGPIGELGRHLWETWDEDHITRLTPPNWRRHRHAIHRQPLDYPLRRHPMPDIWDYLGIAPHKDFIHLYCPGDYWPWRAFSTIKRLPPPTH